MENKKIHVKSSFYTYCFLELKEIALKYGYNLVLHGSVNRDLDLIAIHWQQELKSEEDHKKFQEVYHGRKNYIINLNRGGKKTNYEDSQFYIDISVTPTRDQKFK